MGGEEPVIHDIKCWPQYFERLLDGSKTFEVRKNDRGYQAGDRLRIREWEPGSTYHASRYTTRELEFAVGFVLSSSPLADLGEFVVLSLLPTKEALDA